MLHKLVVENFWSFRDRTEIDFRVPARNDLDPFLRPSPTDQRYYIPTAIGFFGANGSGKTTVLRAFAAIRQFILQPADRAWEDGVPIVMPFRTREAMTHPSRIRIEFDTIWNDESPACMAYSLQNVWSQETGRYVVGDEQLDIKMPEGWEPIVARVRNGQGYTYRVGPLFDLAADDRRLDFISEQVSLFPVLAQFNHEPSRWFLDAVEQTYSNLYYERHRPLGPEALEYFLRVPEAAEQLNREIIRAHLGIESIDLTGALPVDGPVFRHHGLDGGVPWYLESQGTRRFIELFRGIWSVKENRSVAICDELDVDLHPNMLAYILEWFLEGDDTFAPQILFTANDASAMKIIPKECIFFVEKSREGTSTCYGAREFADIDEMGDLDNLYLNGSLGAVPRIG